MFTRIYGFVGSLVILVLLVGCSPNTNTNKNSGYSPAESNETLSFENLEGMFAGFRDDFGGYECGGLCWDFYTFLPNDQILIGLPKNGGPETIDCNNDDCVGYSISNGQLELENRETFTIEITEDETLIINDVRLEPVQPVDEGTTLNNHYKYIGYYGLVGVTGAASSWTYYLSLYPDETFELSGVTLGSLGANSGTSTHTSHTDATESGMYSIQNNTITFESNDGEIKKMLFLIHDSDINDIQIGEKNYYVDDD